MPSCLNISWTPYKHIFFALLISFLILPEMGFCQITNPGYTGTMAHKDSVLWQPRYLPPIDTLYSNEINFEISAPLPEHQRANYYDPKSVMPANPFYLDYRGGSYYVPRQVNNRIAQMMNRPSPDSFVPVFAIAMLAAKVALHYVNIEHKIRIEASDYLVQEKSFPLLQALWVRSPQTAFELYELNEVNENRTFVQTESELQVLVDQKLIKSKTQEEAPTLYFVAQSRETVLELLTAALTQDSHSETEKNTFHRLIILLNDL